jgi:hypothetical protein
MTPQDTIETSVGPVPVLHRLALGLLARDAVTSRGVADGLRAGWEAHRRLVPRGHPIWWPCVDLERVGGGRFRLRATPARPGVVVVRLVDLARRYVPRRLEVTLWPYDALVDPLPANQVAVASRTLPVWLAPGAAYPLPRGATAVRGRVARAGAPVRWARVVAVGPGNAVLGRAHADDRGEFLLLLGETNQNPVQSTVDVDLRVRGPVAAPAPGPEDPFADLPAEPVPRPANPPAAGDLDNPLLRGVTPPPSYAANAAPVVHLSVDVGAELTLRDDVPFDPQP